MYALTPSNQVYGIASITAPGTTTGPFSITGITSGQTLMGMDYSPFDGNLYGLGYNTTSGTAQLYLINTSTWAAMPLGGPLNISLGTASTGGFDFVPTSDNLVRIVGSNGNAYLLSTTDGSISYTGATPSYAAGDAGGTATPQISGVNYYNSFYGADATRQVGYDRGRNVFVRYNNDGTVSTVGGTGLILGNSTEFGMDASYSASSHTNNMYFTARPLLGLGSTLYKINDNGTATSVGAIGTGNLTIRDITIPVSRGASGPYTGSRMAGLTLNQHRLVWFDAGSPGVIRQQTSVTGLNNGQNLMAIAYSPFDLQLYGFGYNNTNFSYQLYRIDTTGSVTMVGSSGTIQMGADTNNLSMAFNPTNNTVHVTSMNGLHLILSANGGFYGYDSSFRYTMSDPNYSANAPRIGSVAFLNSYGNTPNTRLIGIDYSNGNLIRVSDSVSYQIQTIANYSSLLDTGMNTNGIMDIGYDRSNNANTMFIASNRYNNSDRVENYSTFYDMSYSSPNLPASQGSVGPGVPLRGMAAQRNFSASTSVLFVNGGGSIRSIYPNPVLDNTHIVLNSRSTVKIELQLIDMNGRVMKRLLYNPGLSTIDLDMSNMPTGLYNLTLRQGGVLDTYKVYKN